MVKKEKRGLSPIVATVLLIALAIVLAMIVFLWARGFISEQIEKRGEPIDQICELVNIQVDYSSSGSNIELIVVNMGSIPVHSVEVREIDESGSSSINIWNISANTLGHSSQRSLAISPNTKEIVIYPRIIGTVRGKSENKEATCLTKGKSIEW